VEEGIGAVVSCKVVHRLDFGAIGQIAQKTFAFRGTGRLEHGNAVEIAPQ
jgi:hypothetical protein